jgi:RNA polymerase sigma factor (sigma-70 family)
MTDPRRAVEAVWRIESARVIAGLARIVRDVGLAEELAQDAFVIALEQWPESGVPDNPGAWLMATAKHRAIDLLRRQTRYQRKLQELGRDLEVQAAGPDLDAALDDPIGDDLLRLVFIACHPVLSTEARVALTLRLLGGLTAGEIARAFLVPEPTVAQRIVRAKRTLAGSGVQFELPPPAELAERLASVLEVIYLIFNEGYSATAGDDWMRPALCQEALRLGRILAGLMPREPEVHGLLALMEIQASRTRARTGPSGAAVLLPDQDRRLWDRLACACPGGHRLGADRRALPGARPRVAVAGGGAEPGGRGRHGRRPRQGPGGRRRGRLGAGPGRVPAAAGRARRPARQARPLRRGAAGVPARRHPHAQPARARPVPGPRRRLPAGLPHRLRRLS